MNSGDRVASFALVISVIAIATTVPVLGDNWPQWRGARLDSVSRETSLPSELSIENGQRWRVPLPGPAGSSPVVWEDRIFLTSTNGTEDGAEMFLICIGVDGKEKWKQQLTGANQNSRDSANSASPSPSTDGVHVWAMMGNGFLHCFSIEGKLIWKKDLQAEYGKFNIQFGMTSSPILDKGRLYLSLMHGDMGDQVTTSQGHVIALDAATGEQIWYHQRLTDGVSENTHSYASPTIYRDQDREYLITHGADYVIGHSLTDGAELWRCGGINIKGPNYNPYLRFVSSPTCVPGMIIIPTAKRGPVLALQPDLSGDVTGKPESFLWKMDHGTPDVASPLIYEGLVYLADEKGVLICVDGTTGEVIYQQRLFAGNHRSTPVAADGKIFIVGRDGEVFVVKAGRKFELLSKTNLAEEATASPAIAGGIIYIRTFESLYAFGN